MYFSKKKKSNILFYADSRGENLPKKDYYKHYGDKLSRKHNVTSIVTPHKWTTTMDFLYTYDKELKGKAYDYIILHTGIVDYSPRQQKILVDTIYPSKKKAFEHIFPRKEILKHIHKQMGTRYENDHTSNMYSKEMATHYLIPKLSKIKNLIWISSNRIHPYWRGNYWKDRPSNMYITEEYSTIFISQLRNTINLLKWHEEQVKKYTYDNIHPNMRGSNYIYNEIQKILNDTTK
jgi:hypothetical protein